MKAISTNGNNLVDVTSEMRDTLNEIAATNLVLFCNQVLNIVKKGMDEKHDDWTGMTNFQAKARACCVRHRTVGKDTC